MKTTNLTRQRSADIQRGLVHPSAARSLSWIEECTADGDITEGAVVVVQSDGTVALADTAQDPRPTGVALDDMDDGEEGQVCFGGPVDLVLVTASVTAGNYAETSTTPGEAAETTDSAAAFGYFTSSGTTPSAFVRPGRGGGLVPFIESLSTAETDDSLVLAPDGAGGVEFRAESGGGGGGDATVAVYAYSPSGSGPTISRSTYQDLALTNEGYDTDGFHSTVTNNSRFTVPSGKGGLYTFAGSATCIATASSDFELYVAKNGSLQNDAISAATYHGTATAIAGDVVLDDGDYLTLRTWTDYGSGSTVAIYRCALMMRRVGDAP